MIPPTFTEETKREFDIEFGVLNTPDGSEYFEDGISPWPRKIKSFLLSRTTAAYDLRTKEVREIVEGMKQNQPEATHNGISGQDYDYAYNSALSDLLTRLTK